MATNNAVSFNQLKKSVFNMKNYINNKLPVISEETILATIPVATLQNAADGSVIEIDNFDISCPENVYYFAEYNGIEYIACNFYEKTILLEYTNNFDVKFYGGYQSDENWTENENKCRVEIVKIDRSNITDIVIKSRKIIFKDDTLIHKDLKIYNSISSGNGNVGKCSFAIGYNCSATAHSSHAEGNGTIASGGASHAEGNGTIASNRGAHAEGGSTVSSGDFSHAEGFETKALIMYSHAEGKSTVVAAGIASHVEGYGTITASNYQHAQGKFNIKDTAGKYAHIVGNGKNNNSRSNAHTLDWSGNGWFAGKVTQEGTPIDDKDLVNKKYVDDANIEATDEEVDAMLLEVLGGDYSVQS